MPARPLFNYEKIVRAYKVFGSTRKVADLVGCSNYTVCMVVRKAGVKPTEQGLTERNRWKFGKPPGVVAKWHAAHPDVQMPLKPSAIERLVGCTRADAYHYLEWRRNRFKKKVFSLPSLQPYLGEEYSITLDKKHFRVIFTLRASAKTVILYEDELDALLLRLTSSSGNPSR